MADPDAGFPCHVQRYPGPPLPTPNHIRLVLLQPGNDDSITCELQAAEIDSAPAYEALSYTWGDPLDRQAIYITASEAGEKEEFLVTKNCFSALRRLRLTDRTRILWIDALAIDQSNLTERNHQVTLMSQIFSKATKVAIYLGESGDDSDLAMDMIEDCHEPRSNTTSLGFPKTDRLVQALITFFHRPWFTRVWIIQEAILSNSGTIYCGDRTLSWFAIHNYHVWNTVNKWHTELPFVVSASRERLVQETIQHTMYNALIQTRQCEATDPRDKVYSLLPLLHSFERQLDISPSYGEPSAKVFTDIAVALMVDCGFQILRAVQGSSSIDGLPSWVPDWSVPPKRRMIGTDDFPEREWGKYWKSHEHMDVPREPRIVVEKMALTLRLAGFRCGKIEKLGSAYFAGKGQLPLKEWHSLLPPAKSRGVWFLNDPFYWVLISTHWAYPQALSLFLEREQESERSGSATGWERRVQEMRIERSKKHKQGGGQEDDGSFTLPFGEIPFQLAGQGLVPSYQAYVQQVLGNCHSRRFFITERGHMGMAPAEAQVGDDVYMAVGATPYILRDGQQSVVMQLSGVKRFRLVGECFLEDEALGDMVFEDFEYFEIV